MHRLQLLLRLTGGFGFLIWFIIVMLVSFSFGPGKPVNPISGYPKLFAVLGPFAGFLFCAMTAQRKPTPMLLILGMVIQSVFVVGIFFIHTRTDGGFLVTPLLSLGPILWLAYVIGARITRFEPTKTVEPTGTSPLP